MAVIRSSLLETPSSIRKTLALLSSLILPVKGVRETSTDESGSSFQVTGSLAPLRLATKNMRDLL